MSDTVWLQRPSGDIPWGFRLGGGSDLGEPLSVHRVTAGSIAATGLNKGDVVLRIGDSETAGLTNMEANECIKKCGNLLQLHVSKMGASNNYGSSPGAPPPMHQSYQVAPEPQSSSSPAAVHDLFANLYSSYDTAPRSYSYNPTPAPPVKPLPQAHSFQKQNAPQQGNGWNARQNDTPQWGQQQQQPVQKESSQQPTTWDIPIYHADSNTNSTQQRSQQNNGYSNDQQYQPVYGRSTSQKHMTDVYSPSKAEPLHIDTSDQYHQYHTEGDQNTGFVQQLSQSHSPKPAYHAQAYPASMSSSTSELSDYSYGDSRWGHDSAPTIQGTYTVQAPQSQNSYSVKSPDKPNPPVSGYYSAQTPDHEVQQPRFIGYNSMRGTSFDEPPPPPLPDMPPPSEDLPGTPRFEPPTPPWQSTYSQPSWQQQEPTSPPPPLPASAPPAPPPPQAAPAGPPAPPPPPPPPLLSSAQTNQWKAKQPAASNSQPPPPQQQQQQQPAHRPNTWQPPQQPHSPVSPLSPGGSGRAPTRLEQQLSNLSMGQPLSPVHYPEEEAPKPAAPQSVAPGGPGYGQPQFVGPSSYSKKSPPSAQQTKGPAMPDAVLNMAAKGPPEKKPWAYAVDMDSIQSQRDKMNAQRKKAPPGNLPRYQHMLNMPDFSDAPVPPHVKQQPQQQQQQQQQQQEEKPMEDGMYAHAQYNSPLQMYSNENVNEAFSGQTQGEVMGVKPGDSPQGAGNAPKKDIVMSPTYRLIHGLDAEKPRPKVIPPPEARQMVRGPREDDETKFSGFHTQADIPSKSFHRLQQQVSHPDTGAPHQDSLGVDDAVGNYDETSIRYRGRNIPSKSFRMLQNMTGGPVEQLPAEEVAVPDTQPTDQTAIATERRRRRRNQSGGDQLEEAPKNPDFDEKAYLSGRVQIVSGSVNNPHAAAPFEKASSSTPAPEWKKDKTPEREFDESAFLAGRYATINDEATPIPARGHNGVHNAESPEQEKHFDENAFLQGKIPVLSDEPKEFAPRARPQREMAPWELRRKEEEEEEARRQAEFDEQAFLSGRIPLVRGDSHDPTPLAKVAYTHKPKKRVQEEEERPQIENYDEDAFLSGKISILGGDNNPALPPRQPRKKPEKELASWQKRRQNAHVPLENGDAQQVEHGDGPVKSAPKKKVHRERAPWERPNEEDDFDSACSSDAEFDEHAFLRGRVPTVRSSQEREMSGSEGGFDQIPSRKFTMLRRSVSRDRSPSRESDTSDYSSYRDGNEGGDPDRVIKKLTYKGGAIPSKTFMKLQRRVNRGAVPPSPSPQPSTADQGLDVDQAMDKMSMENKDPNEYFDQLKKSMQEQDVKIEPEEEITDF